MLKQSVMLEVKQNDKVYQFHFPVEAPLGEIHDVLFQMRSFVVEKINAAQKLDEKKEPEVKSE